MPLTSSPTRWVSRMYAAQQAAAPSANATPTGSAVPAHGWVRKRTPPAASSAQRRPVPRLRTTATPSGPRNSSALAVPSGSRATAAMNSMVRPAVTTPSAMPARSASRLYAERRGRTITSMSAPAHTSRSQAAPSAPTWSIRPTEAARPSWTQSMETIAIEAPARDWDFMQTSRDPARPYTST